SSARRRYIVAVLQSDLTGKKLKVRNCTSRNSNLIGYYHQSLSPEYLHRPTDFPSASIEQFQGQPKQRIFPRLSCQPPRAHVSQGQCRHPTPKSHKWINNLTYLHLFSQDSLQIWGSMSEKEIVKQKSSSELDCTTNRATEKRTVIMGMG